MVFFVTGGSRGIGEGVVLEALAQGHDVAFTYRERHEQAREVVARGERVAQAGSCRAYQLDVRDPGSVERVADQVLEDFDTVQVVVANAEVTRDGLAATMSNEDWQTVIDVNLSGPFYIVRQFLPTLLTNGWGRIILVSSVSYKGMSGQVNYAASKAGLVGLSGTLAKEYGRKGITSNVIVPGFFDTDLTRTTLPPAMREMWLQLCPAGRVGEVSDVSRLVLFLASGAADFVNGQVIPVTGGLDWLP